MGVRGVYRRAWLVGCAVVLLGTFAGCGDPGKVARGGAVVAFGHYGKAPGEFIEPNGIAIDHQTGDVFVVDSFNARVDKFKSDGAFVRAWGWGVADGKNLVMQTCTSKCFEGIEGPGVGQFQFPEGVAVDNDPSSPSHGDLYVVDIGNHRIQKFSPNGQFLLAVGNGVNNVAHQQGYHTIENRCPVNRGDICGPGSEGPSEAPADSQLEFAVEGDFIAVGQDGTIYVGQRNSVKEFSPEGVYKTQIKLTPALRPTASDKEAGGVSALAVDSSGAVYVVRHGITGVNEYAPSGKLLRTLEQDGGPATPEGPTPALALSPNGNVFVDIHTQNQHRIDEFSPAGVKLASFDEGQEDGLHGLAYNQQTGRLYVVSAGNKLHQAQIRITTPPHG